MDNANHLYDGLQKLGYELSSHIGPVVPVIISSKERKVYASGASLFRWAFMWILSCHLPRLRASRCCAVA